MLAKPYPVSASHCCALRGWRESVPRGGAFRRCGGRLSSGAPSPRVASPLGGLSGSATHVPWARVCGCGGPALSPWLACPVGGSVPRGWWGPSPGGLAFHPGEGRLVSGDVPVAGSPGSATRVSRVRFPWAWGPSTSLTACALASRRCALWGWWKGVPRGGAFRCCEGRLSSGAPPPPPPPPSGLAVGVRYPRAVGRGVRVWGRSTVRWACLPCGGLRAAGVTGAVPWGAGLPPQRGASDFRRCPSAGRPPSEAGSRGSATRVSWVRLVCAWGPSTGSTACALASCRCTLWGWRKSGPGGGTFCRCRCQGHLSSGAPPPERAGCRGRLPTCFGRGCVGLGAQHCTLGLHALWGLRAAGMVGGRPWGGGRPTTVVRGIWGQALSLPPPPVLWGARPGFRDPCVPGAVGVGVGTQHRPHSVRPCEPSLPVVRGV